MLFVFLCVLKNTNAWDKLVMQTGANWAGSFVVRNKNPESLGRVGAGPAGDGKTHAPALQTGSQPMGQDPGEHGVGKAIGYCRTSSVQLKP